MFQLICRRSMPLALLLAPVIAGIALAQSAPTRYGSVAELEGDITCGRGTGGYHSYLETESIHIYVCSDEQDPSQPRFYRSFSPTGELGLSLIAEDYEPTQGPYTIFVNEGYDYILDPGDAQTQTAFIIVRDPDGTIVAEDPGLVYLSQDYEGSESEDSHEVFNGCLPEETLFVTAETDNFYVSICGGDLPKTYVGMSKSDGTSIRLSIESYDPQGSYFEAINGDVIYLLTPEVLEVTQGSEILLSESILVWN